MNKIINNLLLIEKYSDRFHIVHQTEPFDFFYNVSLSKDDTFYCDIISGAHTTTIYSHYYSLKEIEKQIESFVSVQENIVVFGFILGHHVFQLLKRFSNKNIYIIEPDKNLFIEALNYIDLESFNNCSFYIGYHEYEIPHFLNGLSFDCFKIASYVKLHQKYFNLIEKKLFKQNVFDLSDQWHYKKFSQDSTRILFIDSSYVLTKECLTAIQNTGNYYKYIHIDKDQLDFEVFLKQLLNDIAQFKPDFILTINHLGFDQEGWLTELLTQIEMPFVSWFVDSPNVILSTFKSNVSNFCNLFLWDMDYEDDIRNQGYTNIDYLPLATSKEIFFEKDSVKKYDVSFVGSSMVYAINKNLKSFVHRPDLLQLLEKTVLIFLTLKTRDVNQAIMILKNQGIPFIFEDQDQRDDFEAAVLWRSTQIYRLGGLLKLKGFNTTISGDPNWDRLLPVGFKIIRERWYYDNLCDFYNQSRINFNMTSKQMKNAVNQRVFDVPACGQFLITDYKPQLEEVYNINSEVICFNNIEEIPELVNYYLKNEKLRTEISIKAQEKVLAYHTYENRIHKMINIMKKRYQ